MNLTSSSVKTFPITPPPTIRDIPGNTTGISIIANFSKNGLIDTAPDISGVGPGNNVPYLFCISPNRDFFTMP